MPAGPGAEHQVVAGQQVQIARLGRGLGRHARRAGRPAARRRADGRAAPGGWSTATRTSASATSSAGVGALGDGLDRRLARAPRLGVAVQRHAAAGRLHQHVEGVLDQGGVAAVRARRRRARRRRTGAGTRRVRGSSGLQRRRARRPGCCAGAETIAHRRDLADQGVRRRRRAPPADRGCGRRPGPAWRPGFSNSTGSDAPDLGGVEGVLLLGRAAPAAACRRSSLTALGDLARHGRGRRAGAAGIFEREGAGVADLAHQLERRLEVGLASRRGSRR